MNNYYNTGVTVELGEIVRSGVKVWDFEYPVPRSEIEYNGKFCKVDFDKDAFEKKVLDHYWFRQIGQETVGRFLHYFRARIREIMPYYVQVYEFDAKFRNIEDPLESYNLTETFAQQTQGTGKLTGSNSNQNTETSERSGTLTGTETGDKVTKFSDTPQGSVGNLDAGYLTNVTQEETSGGQNQTSEESGTVSNTGSGTNTQDTEETGETTHTLTRRGNIGVQPLGGEVENIRSAFINIDMQIIEDLRDLFLMVY